jgi:dihydrodipicolinate synthase/N-acetylneuraminate lyase
MGGEIMKKLYGVTVAMITPLDDQDRIIESSVQEHVEFLIQKGVQCLYPLGTTGEMFLLDIAERKRVAQIVVEQAKGRVPVFIHVGAMRAKDTLELARHACAIGADGIGAVTPAFFSVNDRELEEYYVSISGSVPDHFPIYMYSIPQCAGNDITPAVAEKIVARTPNVIGIKYSYADMLRTSRYLQVNNGQFSVLHGADRLFNALLTMGCAGVVSGLASVFPEPFVAIYDAFRKGNLEKTRGLQETACKLGEILLNGTNMAYYKAGLKMRGIDAGHMRKPLLDLSVEQIADLKMKLEAYI